MRSILLTFLHMLMAFGCFAQICDSWWSAETNHPFEPSSKFSRTYGTYHDDTGNPLYREAQAFIIDVDSRDDGSPPRITLTTGEYETSRCEMPFFRPSEVTLKFKFGKNGVVETIRVNTFKHGFVLPTRFINKLRRYDYLAIELPERICKGKAQAIEFGICGEPEFYSGN